MSLELLPGNAVVWTMGLLAVEEATGLEQCWDTLGETGSIFTMAGAELRQTGGERTTAEREIGVVQLNVIFLHLFVEGFLLTRPRLVHRGETLQYQSLCGCGGRGHRKCGDTHRSRLDGRFRTQDAAGF